MRLESTRDRAIDSAKFFLVALVVIGHVVENTRGGNAIMNALYRFIYVFHVPALAYISGVVSTTDFGLRQGRQLLSGILLPYLVFQGLYLWQAAAMTGGAWSLYPTNPYWLLWYLPTLIAWRLSLPILMAARWPIALAVVIALGAGLSMGINTAYSASRTLVFLPFFVAGHMFRMPTIRRVRGAIAGLVVLAAVAWVLREANPYWLYGSSPYRDIKVDGLAPSDAQGIAFRAIALTAGALGTWSVIQLVSVQWAWSAWLGQQSLGIYLLHGFLIRWAVAGGLASLFFRIPDGWRTLASAVAGLLLAAAVGALSTYLKPALDYKWLWRQTTRAGSNCQQVPTAPGG